MVHNSSASEKERFGQVPPLSAADLRRLEKRFCRPCDRPTRWREFRLLPQHESDQDKVAIKLYGRLLAEMCDEFRPQKKTRIFQSVNSSYTANLVTKISQGSRALESLDEVWQLLFTILAGVDSEIALGSRIAHNAAQPSETSRLVTRIFEFYKHRPRNASTPKSGTHYFHPSLQHCAHASCYAEATALYVQMLDKLENRNKERPLPTEAESHVFLISGYEPFSSGREPEGSSSENVRRERHSDPGVVFQHAIAECVNAGMNLTFIVCSRTRAAASAAIAKKQIERIASATVSDRSSATPSFAPGSIKIHAVAAGANLQDLEDERAPLRRYFPSNKPQSRARERQAGEYLGGLFRYALYIWPPDNRVQTHADDFSAANVVENATLLVLRTLTPEASMLRVFDPTGAEVEDCIHWVNSALLTPSASTERA
jgi:hypothetical protein